MAYRLRVTEAGPPGPPRELGAEAEYHRDLAFLVVRPAVHARPGSAVAQQVAPPPNFWLGPGESCTRDKAAGFWTSWALGWA